jgi:hypothetical protein
MRMKWTPEAPTKIGFYWMRLGSGEPTVVEIGPEHGHGELAVWRGDRGFVDPISVYSVAVWCGPLEVPEDE